VKVAVLSRRSPEVDAQCDRLAAGLLAAGHDVVHVDIVAFGRGTVSFDPAAGLVVADDVVVEPSTLDAVVLGPLPAAVGRTAPSGTGLGADEHFARARIAGERHVLAWSIVLDWERRGVPVLSSPSRARPFDHKPFQLASLAPRVPVPRTLISADPAALRAFVDAVGDCVVKPVTGGQARAFEPERPPVLRPGEAVIMQERVRGQDIRAVVIGGDVVAVAAFDPAGDDEVVDVRARAAFREGSGRFVPVDAPALVDVAQRAARTCLFDLAAVDLKRRADGSVVVLEVNRTPVVLDLEDDLGAPITERFVALVERRVAERPT
jgi:glutathione synthase/RimK-type ligase-like ATP-grasp enzyme